jgi:Na+/melibiose symporter-like transporter
MRYVLLSLIVIFIVMLIAFTDFILLRLVRERITEINGHAHGSYRFRPITILNALMVSLAFWVPPFYLLKDGYLLEAKIFFTLIYWLASSICLYFYIRVRSSPKTAKESLVFLILFAIVSGMLLLPALTAINSLLGS